MSSTHVEKTMQTGFLTYDRTLGITAMDGRGLYFPADMTFGADGNIYVANRSNYAVSQGIRVTILDLEENFYSVFGSKGREPGQFIWAIGIASDSKGMIYLSDAETNMISVFDADGNYQSRWGTYGADEGQFDGLSGIAFDAEDNLYVVDSDNSRVQKFTKDGGFLFSFGSYGAGEGEMNLPWGITVDPKGDVYVADWRNDRIQRFSPSGEFLAEFGESGNGDGQFNRPTNVAVDADGYMYVADWGNERVQVLDSKGGFVQKLRGEATLSKWAEEFMKGNAEEAEARARANLEPVLDFVSGNPHEESSHVEKYFWAPVAVELDAENRLYVTETNRHRIQVYARAS
jgi:DNA-binding beta-propeller fold protein YncE